MAAKSENQIEIFKRALAHAARSLAEQPDLEVTFSGAGPGPVQSVRVMSVVPSRYCPPLSMRYSSLGRIGRLLSGVTR